MAKIPTSEAVKRLQKVEGVGTVATQGTLLVFSVTSWKGRRYVVEADAQNGTVEAGTLGAALRSTLGTEAETRFLRNVQLRGVA